MLYIYGRLNSTEFYDNGGPLDPPDPNWVLMTGYPPSTSTHVPPYTYYEYRAQADGTWLEFEIPAPARVLVLHDGKLKTVDCIYLGTDRVELPFTNIPGYVAPPATKRRTRMDITLGTGGTATVSIVPATGAAYAVAPDIDPIVTTNSTGTITYVPRVTSVSASSLTVSALRTKGTLVLSAGPIEVAVAGDVVSVWILEK